MPRQPRIISSVGIYHTILRSVNQKLIFEEEFDYQKFLFILNDSRTTYGVDILAYCIMDNHIHMLIKTPEESLSNFFHNLETRFAIWYNRKYQRSGHLFQNRFHSIPVESRISFLNTLVYIHNNPIKAGICRHASEYRWSSYNAFYGARNPILNLDFTYNLIGSKDSIRAYFSISMENENLLSEDDSYEYYPKIHLINDEAALEQFKNLTTLNSTSEVDSLNRVQRNELIRMLKRNRFTNNQIARILGVSPATIKRVNSNYK